MQTAPALVRCWRGLRLTRTARGLLLVLRLKLFPLLLPRRSLH